MHSGGHDPWANIGVAEANEAEQLEREKSKRAEFVANLKWVMERPRGRALMRWLLGKTGVFSPNHNLIDEGSRRVGLELHSMLDEHCMEAYFTMRQEERE